LNRLRPVVFPLYLALAKKSLPTSAMKKSIPCAVAVILVHSAIEMHG